MASGTDSQPKGALADPLVGQVLGGSYEVVRLVGRGGMGAVYEVKNVRLPKRFAIKVLAKQWAEDKESFLRFRREAEIASSVGSNHIAEVFDFNSMPDGTPFMLMEFLDGEDLRQRLTRGRLTIPEAQTVCEQTVSALSEAHARGITHRDIKPGNIFLTPSSKGTVVKLVDFGLSKMRDTTTLTTQSNALLGTPAYMSPEQAKTEGKGIDHRTDIYSLGAVMYEALSGKRPFGGQTIYELIYNIVNEKPPSMLLHAPELPVAVDDAIQWAMAKDPTKRPGSGDEFFQALKYALSGASAGAVAVAPVIPPASDTSTAKWSILYGSTAPTPGMKKARFGRPLPWAIGLVAVVAAVAGVSFRGQSVRRRAAEVVARPDSQTASVPGLSTLPPARATQPVSPPSASKAAVVKEVPPTTPPSRKFAKRAHGSGAAAAQRKSRRSPAAADPSKRAEPRINPGDL